MLKFFLFSFFLFYATANATDSDDDWDKLSVTSQESKQEPRSPAWVNVGDDATLNNPYDIKVRIHSSNNAAATAVESDLSQYTEMPIAKTLIKRSGLTYLELKNCCLFTCVATTALCSITMLLVFST